MDLATSKNLGGVGAILLAIGPLASFRTVFASSISIIGVILVLVALKGLADHYNESSIFNNALYGLIASIVGGVVSVGVLVGTALVAIAAIGISDWTNATEWMTAFTVESILALLGALIIAFVILFVFIILTAWLYKRSLNTLATKSGVHMFSTTGLILLIGALLSIVLIGFILIWVAFILLAVAFFSIKTTTA